MKGWVKNVTKNGILILKTVKFTQHSSSTEIQSTSSNTQVLVWMVFGFWIESKKSAWIFKRCISQSGPRCVARFDFEGEHGDELTFSEGDVIQLKAYVGQDWARGQLGTLIGIFPLNFVEVIEDLPPPPSQQHLQSEAAKPAQVWDIYINGEGGRSSSPVCFTSSSVMSAGWCRMGGGSVWLCWKFRRRPVLSAGRSHSDQPAHWLWVELRSPGWQGGDFPHSLCWERRYEVGEVTDAWNTVNSWYCTDTFLSFNIYSLDSFRMSTFL